MAEYKSRKYAIMPVNPQSAGEVYLSYSRFDVPPGPVPPAITLAGTDKIYMDMLPPGCVIDEIAVNNVSGFSGTLVLESEDANLSASNLMTLSSGTIGADGKWRWDGAFRDWSALVSKQYHTHIYITVSSNPGTSFKMEMRYRTVQTEDFNVCYGEAI